MVPVVRQAPPPRTSAAAPVHAPVHAPVNAPAKAPASGAVCPTEQALDVIACKWTARIIYLLAGNHVLRFSEVRRGLGSITHKELTKQLRRLEQHGLVHRQVFAEVPPRVEYRLTLLGATLVEPLSALSRWATEHAATVAAHRESWQGPGGEEGRPVSPPPLDRPLSGPLSPPKPEASPESAERASDSLRSVRPLDGLPSVDGLEGGPEPRLQRVLQRTV